MLRSKLEPSSSPPASTATSRRSGEFGYGIEGVVTLPEFKRMIDETDRPADIWRRAGQGHRLRLLRRQPGGAHGVNGRPANQYCSRYCCTATVHARFGGRRPRPPVRQYHLYRDIRTYGKYELMYNESREKGSLYLKFADDEPPVGRAGRRKRQACRHRA